MHTNISERAISKTLPVFRCKFTNLILCDAQNSLVNNSSNSVLVHEISSPDSVPLLPIVNFFCVLGLVANQFALHSRFTRVYAYCASARSSTLAHELFMNTYIVVSHWYYYIDSFFTYFFLLPYYVFLSSPFRNLCSPLSI